MGAAVRNQQHGIYNMRNKISGYVYKGDDVHSDYHYGGLPGRPAGPAATLLAVVSCSFGLVIGPEQTAYSWLNPERLLIAQMLGERLCFSLRKRLEYIFSTMKDRVSGGDPQIF